jgi:hypothetical protein
LRLGTITDDITKSVSVENVFSSVFALLGHTPILAKLRSLGLQNFYRFTFTRLARPIHLIDSVLPYQTSLRSFQTLAGLSTQKTLEKYGTSRIAGSTRSWHQSIVNPVEAES